MHSLLTSLRILLLYAHFLWRVDVFCCLQLYVQFFLMPNLYIVYFRSTGWLALPLSRHISPAVKSAY